MKLAVSSIAWTNEEEEDVAQLLHKLGVKYVEIAPTKLWDDPTKATQAEVQSYKKFWEKYGIKVIAFQSMLFNRPDLMIFDNAKNRAQTLEYLKSFIVLASEFGTSRMVFGSPKNRKKGSLKTEQVTKIANNFFSELGEHSLKHGVHFCIEPNPKTYDCDFITTASEGIEIVKMVNSRGFRLHLDIAGMTMAKDIIRESVLNSKNYLEHFHVSSPFLEQVELRDDVQHLEAAKALREINYNNFISIEMRPAEKGQNVLRVKKAVEYTMKTYLT